MAKNYDRRIKEMFLLFPKTIGNHQKWLIRAKWVQIYHYNTFFLRRDTRGWVDDHWIDN